MDEYGKRKLMSMLPGETAPDYLHFREPDGSISSKRYIDCTLPDLDRHLEQFGSDIERLKRGEISNEDFELLYVDPSWGHQN